jgi:tripartite-type tricarboxylate transporter receptor subunit TctC
MKHLAALLALSLGFLGMQADARADEYPGKPITMVVGFPPGAGPDILARQLARAISKRHKWVILVENRAGAIGTIAATKVALAAPDGYTLLFGVAANLVSGPAILRDPPYDPTKAFAPVIEVARGPYILLTSTRLPVHSVKELVDYAKANPGKLNFGSVGPGSPHHYASELFKKAAGIDIVHVPFKGGAQAYSGIVGNEIQMLFDTMPGPMGQISQGNIRALAIAGSERLKLLPDVPTMAEAGYPGVNMSFMFGVVAPKDTPAQVIKTLNAAMGEALSDSEMIDALEKQSVEASPGTAEAFGELIAAEFKRWQEIVQTTGFRPD